MKKHITQTIKVLAISLLIGLGVSFAGAWSENLATPPLKNSWAPIRSDLGSQNKEGMLRVGSDEPCFGALIGIMEVCGQLRAGDGILSAPNAVTGFKTPIITTDDITVGYDIDAPDLLGSTSLLIVGGKIIADAGETVPTETIDLGGTARIDDLAAVNNPGYTYPARVCVDTDGDYKLCPLLAASISGPVVTNQEYIPQGGGTANCTADVSFSSSVDDGEAPYTYSWQVKNNVGATAIEVNDDDLDEDEWKSLGTGSTASFHVFVKNPGDSWTMQFIGTDSFGATKIINQTFGIWSIGGCN